MDSSLKEMCTAVLVGFLSQSVLFHNPLPVHLLICGGWDLDGIDSWG